MTVVYLHRRAASAAPPTGDPYWSSVVSLFHFDAADGSTDIIDETAYADFACFGNARQRTEESKFGGSSMYFDGAGDYTVAAYRSAYDLGGNDFTVEAWVYSQNVTSTRYVFHHPHTGGYAAGGWALIQNASGIPFFVFADGTTEHFCGGSVATNPIALSLNTWHHLAASVVASGSDRTMRMFVDGTIIHETTVTATPANADTNCHIGRDRNNLARVWHGYIDELRITVGVARYTADFTPPTAAYPTSGP